YINKYIFLIIDNSLYHMRKEKKEGRLHEIREGHLHPRIHHDPIFHECNHVQHRVAEDERRIRANLFTSKLGDGHLLTYLCNRLGSVREISRSISIKKPNYVRA